MFILLLTLAYKLENKAVAVKGENRLGRNFSFLAEYNYFGEFGVPDYNPDVQTIL